MTLLLALFALTHAGYLAAGWSIGLLAIGAYALSVLVRGRALSKRVPLSRQRWMSSLPDENEQS